MASDFPESLVDAATDEIDGSKGAESARRQGRAATVAVLRALAAHLDNPRGGSNMISGAWLAMRANELEASR